LQQSRIARWCDRIIEGGWLLALVLIPSYFNLLSSRHFEPDKATTLRAIVLVMLAAVLIRWLDRLGSASKSAVNNQQSRWQRLRAIPLLLPVLFYAGVFLLATAFSVMPLTSWWGSYQRLQGTYTNLSYVLFGVVIATHLRSREQLDRFVLILILGSLPATMYGVIQHFQLDPLPWRGDVISRVASTMGNSIFVAAYLILIVPFSFARGIAALHASRQAPRSDAPQLDLLWGLAYLCLVGGALLIVFAALQFGAVVQAVDLRYWWVYPGALLSAFCLFLIVVLRPHQSSQIRSSIWLGGLALSYVLLVGLFYVLGENSGGQAVRPIANRPGPEWPYWMIGGMLVAAIGFALVCSLARRATEASKQFLQVQALGMLLTAAITLVTIFFTQSRGPWIGGMAALFLFFTIVLFIAWRRANQSAASQAVLWRNLLIGELIVALALAGFLITFNLSNAPIFEQLRTMPYIGRMGRLLEVDQSTGLVRKLIWVGDEQAGGAIALITADPTRMVIGYGPETMFVAYNRYYPPSLANIESRGASPDRSHQAYLDELINKGVLGLASYLFVLISFFVLARRLLRVIPEWSIQLLIAAAIAAVSGHAVEGFTGIPIVASLMVLWAAIALTYAIGVIAGEYGATAQVAAVAVEAPAVESHARMRQNQQQGRRRQGTQRGGQRPAPTKQTSAGAGAWLVYGMIIIGALTAVWSFNVDNVYADMRFQQGQNYTEGQQSGLDQYLIGSSFYLDALRMEPDQDFYYLNLGRSLMSIVDIQRQSTNQDLGQARSDVKSFDLFEYQEPADLQQFVISQPPMVLMSYAEAVLLDAQRLSPLNKDHFANLGRMYNFWYSRLQRDPAILDKAVDWYRRGVEVAPQDVSILNEYAAIVAVKASEAQKRGDQATADQSFVLANELLARSSGIDPRYRDTEGRIAEVLRLQGRYAEAVDRYLVILASNPRALDSQITAIIEALRDQPALLLKLRSAYEAAIAANPDDFASHALIGLMSARGNDLPRAAAAFNEVIRIQPNNLEARQNYTLVLSDMLQYRQAADQAALLLEAAKQQGANQEEQAALQGLLVFLDGKAAGQ
jgi:tetratricopeptide (TPR) repeat protein